MKAALGLSSNTAIADAKYKFTGKELDAETSLYYFGARYYSAWAGRWLSVDPLAKKYPGWSPYNYTQDDPTALVDPNGLSSFYNEQGKLVRHIDDQSNAVYHEEGKSVHEHYAFTGFDKKQGGKNGVNLASAIQEAQDLNMSNSALQQLPNGTTFCNFATQDVLQTVGSALGIDLDFKGMVASMEREIRISGYFRKVDEATAAENAVGSLSLVIHLGHWEHIATFSSGENVSKGLIANIGPSKYTGFKPLDYTIARSRSREYFILELSKIWHTKKEY